MQFNLKGSKAARYKHNVLSFFPLDIDVKRSCDHEWHTNAKGFRWLLRGSDPDRSMEIARRSLSWKFRAGSSRTQIVRSVPVERQVAALDYLSRFFRFQTATADLQRTSWRAPKMAGRRRGYGASGGAKAKACEADYRGQVTAYPWTRFAERLAKQNVDDPERIWTGPSGVAADN